MIKIGICRHFLQRVETAASRRDGHSRHPKASHACPARPLWSPNACFGRVKKKWGETMTREYTENDSQHMKLPDAW